MQKIIQNIFLLSLIFVLSSFGITAFASSYSTPGPIFSTDYATNVTYNSATLNAMVFGLMDLNSLVPTEQTVYFEYGKNKEALNMISESSGPINGYLAKGVTNLEANTKYYYRVVVDFGPNSIPANHKQYAGIMQFTTLAAPTQNTTTTTTTTNTNTTINSTIESTPRYTSAVAMVKSVSSNLALRSRGENVSKLQTFLIEQNKGVAAQNLAEVGATGYFGVLTRLALAEFQASVGIVPALGYFGSITRAYIANNF